MAYLGNAPARSFISFERQVFTIVNSQTAYTLDHSVNNENDLRLVINNIVQEPGSGKAYTASGTTLTLSAALTNGTDEMYCVFLGRATATNAPAAGSVNTAAIADLNVTTAKIAADAITEAKIADDAVESEHLNNNVISGQTELASAPADTDELLISDAGTIKRIDVSLVGGKNTPAFLASLSANQTIANNTYTKILCNNEVLDTDNCYDNSTNYRFTPTTAGYYFISASGRFDGYGGNNQSRQQIRKNGTVVSQVQKQWSNAGAEQIIVSGIHYANGSSDYFEYWVRQEAGAASTFNGGTWESGGDVGRFSGYKLIT
jgi:hypothetical protein